MTSIREIHCLFFLISEVWVIFLTSNWAYSNCLFLAVIFYMLWYLLIRMLYILFLFLTGTYIDKKCPFTGNVSIRGRILAGTCHSAKMNKTIIVRRNYLHYIKKYQRHDSCIHVLSFYIISAVILGKKKGIMFLLFWNLFLFCCLLKVWEETLEHTCACVSVLPCEGRGSCYHRTVQVIYLTSSSSLHYLFMNIIWPVGSILISVCLLILFSECSGHCRRLRGSMSWRWPLLDLLVLARRLSLEFDLVSDFCGRLVLKAFLVLASWLCYRLEEI